MKVWNVGECLIIFVVLFSVLCMNSVVWCKSELFVEFSNETITGHQLYSVNLNSNHELKPTDFNLSKYNDIWFTSSYSSSFQEVFIWDGVASASGKIARVSHLNSKPVVNFYPWSTPQYAYITAWYELDSNHFIIVGAPDDYMDFRLDVIQKSSGSVVSFYHLQDASTTRLFMPNRVLFDQHSKSVTVLFTDYLNKYQITMITLQVHSNYKISVQNVSTSTFNNVFTQGLLLTYRSNEIWGISRISTSTLVIGTFVNGTWNHQYTTHINISYVFINHFYYSTLEDRFYFTIPSDIVGYFDLKTKLWGFTPKLNPPSLNCSKTRCEISTLFDLAV